MVKSARLNDDRPACQDQACAIQSCLTQTSYNEQKCQPLIDALYTCCARFYDSLNSTSSSASSSSSSSSSASSSSSSSSKSESTSSSESPGGGYKNLAGLERSGVKASTACPLEEVVRRTMRRMEKDKEGAARDQIGSEGKN